MFPPILPGIRTFLKAVAPQLILLASGLVGDPSTSSTAFSSAVLEVEETEETELRRSPKPDGNCGGELLVEAMDARRWEAWLAAWPMVDCGSRLEEKYSEREREPRRSGRGAWLSLDDDMIGGRGRYGGCYGGR